MNNGHSSNGASKPTSRDGRGPMGGRRPEGGMGHGGPMAMMRRGEKPRDFKGTLTKLIQYLGRYRLLILFIWLLAIASTAATIFGPKILGNATTKLFEGVMAQIAGTGSVDFTYIGNITPGSPVALPVFCLVELWPGLDHVQRGDEYHLPLPQGYC